MLLTKARQNEIDTKVQEIYQTTGMSYPENNLLEIMKKLDINVFLTDFGENAGEISGLINKGNNDEKPQILLNKNENNERRTFTLAHELGHYLLHTASTQYRIDKFNYQLDTPEAQEETEANYFAASLLMPKTKFIEIWNKTKNIKAIADFFGVSEAAAINRLRWIVNN
jgi:Zn-dependent peptidase ImmA (M78 family)